MKLHFPCRGLGLAAALLLSTAGAAQAQRSSRNEFFFRNGDKPILLLGDSITEQRMYSSLLEAYVLTRFPDWNVSFRNVGWSGDSASFSQRGGIDNGLPRDVLSLQPSAITIDFGMNDARGGDANYANFISSSTKLAQRLKASGARVALVTPSPEEKYEIGQPGGSAYNQMLWKYAQGLKQVAQKEGVWFVDQYSPFVKVIEAGRKAGVLGKSGVPRLIPDDVHPNWAGHLVMASSILQGLKAPSLVSRVEINAARKVIAVQNCRVTVLPSDDPKSLALSFRREDNALPMPIPEEARSALQVPGYHPLNDLSRYDLKASGLLAPRYDLSIDGQDIGSFGKDELARGVNLSLRAGPITQQALSVLNKVMDKNNTYFARWRNVQLFAAPQWAQGPDIETRRQSELARMDAQIASQEQEIDALRKPQPHIWKLSPSGPAAPTQLGMKTSGKAIELRWQDNAADEAGYAIERSTDGAKFQRLAAVAANGNRFRDPAPPRGAVFYRVRARNRWGDSVSDVVSNAWTGTGLKAEYFDNVDFTALKLTRIDAGINFDWSAQSPAPLLSADTYSVRWSGWVQAPSTDDYTFSFTSDDGVRLWIGEQQIIDNWKDQAPTEASGTVHLQANQKVPIRIEYYNGAGGAAAMLSWRAPGQTKQVIPARHLYRAP